MYHLELEKCKQFTPTTWKLINSFGSYDPSKTSGENQNGKIRFFYYLLWMLLPWQLQLRLAFAKPFGYGLLHQWPGHTPKFNLIENCSRPIPILILFYRYFLPFYPILFYSHSNFDNLSWSVIAPKWVGRSLCWCQSLAFFTLYMIMSRN